MIGRVTCGRADCVCTHQAPCELGWIENRPDGGYESCRPCPVCRPYLTQLAGEFGHSRELLGVKMRDSEERRRAVATGW